MADKLPALLAGFVLGIVSGMGIGGGSLLILLLTLFWGVPQLMAQGINLLYFLPTAATALAVHIKKRRIEAKPALFAVAAGTVGAVGAVFAAGAVDVSLLRRGFGLLVLVLGLREVLFKGEK